MIFQEMLVVKMYSLPYQSHSC